MLFVLIFGELTSNVSLFSLVTVGLNASLRYLLEDLVDEVTHAVGGELGLQLADETAPAHLVVKVHSLQRHLNWIVPAGDSGVG